MPLFKTRTVRVEFTHVAYDAIEYAAERAGKTIPELCALAVLRFVSEEHGPSELVPYEHANESTALARASDFRNGEAIAHAVIDSNRLVVDAINRQTTVATFANARGPLAAMAAWQGAQDDIDDTILDAPSGFSGEAAKQPRLSNPDRAQARLLLRGKKDDK